MRNINISGGLYSNTAMSKYAGMIGEIYGGGEYAIPESDLLSINPDVSHNILVIGGIVPNREVAQEPHSASTIEIELRDLFQFPKKLRDKKLRDKKLRDKKLRDKKLREKKKKTVKIRGGASQVMKFRDVEDQELKTLLLDTGDLQSIDSVLVQPRADSDYAIASAIDKSYNGRGDDSSDDSSDNSSGDSSDDSSVDSSDDITGTNDEITSAVHSFPAAVLSADSVNDEKIKNDSEALLLSHSKTIEGRSGSDSSGSVNADSSDLNIFRAIAN